MLSTRKAKEDWLAQPCEIEAELTGIFPRDYRGWFADIGACDGLSSVRYMRMFPEVGMMIFEPIKENYNQIDENIKAFVPQMHNVISRCVALGPCVCKSKIHVSSGQAPGVTDWDTGNKSSSMLPPQQHLVAHPWCKFGRTEEVNVDTLDNIVSNAIMGARRLEFIHIDVQGFELEVFRGGLQSLKMVKAVWCEVSNRPLYAGQALKGQVLKFMSQQGLYVKKDTCGNRDSGDVLFVRRQYL